MWHIEYAVVEQHLGEAFISDSVVATEEGLVNGGAGKANKGHESL